MFSLAVGATILALFQLNCFCDCSLPVSVKRSWVSKRHLSKCFELAWLTFTEMIQGIILEASQLSDLRCGNFCSSAVVGGDESGSGSISLQSHSNDSFWLTVLNTVIWIWKMLLKLRCHELICMLYDFLQMKCQLTFYKCHDFLPAR